MHPFKEVEVEEEEEELPGVSVLSKHVGGLHLLWN